MRLVYIVVKRGRSHDMIDGWENHSLRAEEGKGFRGLKNIVHDDYLENGKVEKRICLVSWCVMLKCFFNINIKEVMGELNGRCGETSAAVKASKSTVIDVRVREKAWEEEAEYKNDKS